MIAWVSQVCLIQTNTWGVNAWLLVQCLDPNFNLSTIPGILYMKVKKNALKELQTIPAGPIRNEQES
jgi:hypothetical protein